MADFLRSKLSGRKEIPLEEFEVTFENTGTSTYPKVTYKGFKNSDGLDESARVVLRLTKGRSSQSVDCGTVGKPSAIKAKVFESFHTDSFKCSFRIISTEKNASQGKVLGSTPHKKIVLDKTNLEEEGLLNFKFGGNLDPLLWGIDFDDERGPVIEVDKTCPGAREFFRNDSTLLVAIIPTVITRILTEVYEDGARTHTGWKKMWNEWAISMAEEDPPQDDGDLDDWIEKVVEKLMTQHRLLTQFVKSKEDPNV